MTMALKHLRGIEPPIVHAPVAGVQGGARMALATLPG
jgi:NAD(P)H-dependent flavin oxidoreductase YrpB (nitropropane dioxygenase family)